jgi:hypothetical protein
VERSGGGGQGRIGKEAEVVERGKEAEVVERAAALSTGDLAF